MSTIKKLLNWKVIALVISTIILGLFAVYGERLERLQRVITLYDKDKIVANFLGMRHIFNTTTIAASSQPLKLDHVEQSLPESFSFDGEDINVKTFLKQSSTTGFLVLHNGHIITEEYYLGQRASGQHMSFSMAKSFVSALFGIAMAEGHIQSIEQTVTDYVPELKGSGYDGVRIKDVLQMSSGVRFNEDYGDYNSDINRFSRTVAFGQPLDEFVKTLEREREPGTYHHYVSIDTQVLGMVLTRATGKTLSAYLQEKIWQPLGMEFAADWITDDTGMELALGGLNVSLRDYARFGQLYLQQGQVNGQQLVPAQWVIDSTSADAPHVMPGENNPASDSVHGYGYQWWIPLHTHNVFQAQGIYSQYMRIDREANSVIVKTSANYLYNDKSHQWSAKHNALMDAINAHLILHAH
ncbi:serine hydrolase [Alteromonadaceae bacterium BrNp21-10]|nr:serine hydrolase [Alteromonadaceae bacterium BrNp21-10]